MTASTRSRFRNAKLGVLTLFVAAPWAACSSSDTAVTSAPPVVVPPSEAEARFELPATGAPDFLAVPFPSDLYRDATGHIADIPAMSDFVTKNSDFLVAGMKSMDGFARTAGAIFEVDNLVVAKTASGPPAAAVDPASLPASEADSMSATASTMIVDLDATSAATALVPARAAYRDDSSVGAKSLPKLVVFPGRGIVLAEKHQYAAVVTTSVKTMAGKNVTASATFAAIRDGVARTTDAEKLYGGAVDKLATLVPSLADKTKIAVVAVFTTNDATGELIDLRAQFAVAAPPQLKWDAASVAPMGVGLFASDPLPAGFTATLDAWLGAPAKLGDGTDDPADDQATGLAHDAIAAVGTAVFDAPNVLIEQAMGYADATHHTFARDATGKPIVNAAKPTSKIWATIALPKGPVPPGGFPTIIIQHGLGGDRSYILSFADSFAKKGWATAAIESVTFGARASEPSFTTDTTTAYVWNTAAGAYTGPDGFVDKQNGAVDFFGVLKSLGALRDQMRQSVLDIGSFADVLTNPALDLGPLTTAVPGAKLDPSKVVYLGTSLGGMMGAMVAGIDPRLTTLVLNVAGGGFLVELGANSPTLAFQLSLAGGLNFGFSDARFAPGHPLMHILQQVVDPGDPLDFADLIITNPATVNGTKNPPKNIIQIEALYDDYVDNESNEALARAAGFPLASPSAGPRTGVPLAVAMPTNGVISGVPMAGITAVLVQSGPATHGADTSSATGMRTFKIPYGQFDTAVPFPKIAKPFSIKEPYLGLQTMADAFFDGVFTGTGAPPVQGFPAPALDYDGDGVLDATDKDPNNPSVH